VHRRRLAAAGARLRLRGAAVGEEGSDDRGDGTPVVLELAIGEAEGAVAGAGEEGVSGAVVLEGLSRLVIAPRVGFDDERIVFEEEVDLLAADAVVDLRLRKAVGPAESLKRISRPLLVRLIPAS
jgi:hypothetical protein